MDLSLRIVSWLRAKDRTQSQLARALDIRPSAVSSWVTNKSDPTHHNLLAVAAFLGVTMAEFYGDIPGMVDAENQPSSAAEAT